MAPGIVENGIGFVRKQQNPFKVNMAKNMVQNFSLDSTCAHSCHPVVDAEVHEVQLSAAI
jgi:hypothetical protein